MKEKFHPQLNWAWKKFYNLGNRYFTSESKKLRVAYVYGLVNLFYTYYTFSWIFLIGLSWHYEWPHINGKSVWPIFHGPVVLVYIAYIIW